ncbi:DNA-directed RNA polymerase I subunit RPA2 [Pancytospora epiphaga]|nr:DNA-directed RNA polymerase I subunit RPA2 [Pancytospora epiphaga]
MKSSEFGDMHVGQFDALFTNSVIDNVVSKTTPLIFKGFRLNFELFEVHKPYCTEGTMLDRRMLPSNCREQSITYGGLCFLKVHFSYGDRTIFQGFKPAGTFPIMLKSRLCHLRDIIEGNDEKSFQSELYKIGEDPNEPGGYFIVDGYDRLVRFHIAFKRNHMFVVKSHSKDPIYSDYSCFVRSVGDDEIGQKNEIKYCADGNVHYKLFLYKRIYLIPAILILRALINTTDEHIYKSLGADKRALIMISKLKDIGVYSKNEALIHLGSRFRSVIRNDDPLACGKELLERCVLVHLNNPEDKYNFILDSIRKLFLCVDGKIIPDNIDLPSNHELYTEAQLIALCIREKLEEVKRTLYLKVLSVIRSRITTGDSTTSLNPSEAAELADGLTEQQVERVVKIFNSLDFNVGRKISMFLSTGNITTLTCSDILQTSGFTIIAERINFWRFMSHFQSVSRGAFFATLKITTIRKLRPEGWGFLCPVHTPDGGPCGILLHMAKDCFVKSTRSMLDQNVFFEYGLVPTYKSFIAGTPLYFNGRLLGSTEDPKGLVNCLRAYRSENDLCFEVAYEYGPSIFDAIYVSDDIGAMMRRVVNLKTGHLDWIGIKEQVFLNICLAKYKTIDSYNHYDKHYNSSGQNVLSSSHYSDQSKNAIISSLRSDPVFKGYEFMEIDNSGMFSTVAACIPFSDYNPSPRNIYQCQMAKQAMGIPAYNVKTRVDNKIYWLNYLQAPMVCTSEHESLEKYPIGFNCIVAVLSYTAYDMEDAVIINKSAKERGLFSAYIYKNEKIVLEKNSFIEYTPSVGANVRTGDVLVSYRMEGNVAKSIRYEGQEEGFIENLRIFNNSTPCVTVTIRIARNPTIGDKFCSRHGQKGVLSMLWPEVDMPFTEQGLRPDIIINPHAFPSRMTIGMLLESMCGKVALSRGEKRDATPFKKKTVFDDKGYIVSREGEDEANNIGEELKACGFNYFGNEPMYSGITGSEFRTDIFIGSVYYQRLRHMVNDKYQVRTSGAVVATTRQPVGGRKNKGGIRFGEMERDAVIAHGAAYVLKDRLMDCSDRTEFFCCKACNSILFAKSTGCGCGGTSVCRMELPYVFKYLCCELLAMNICVKVEL